MPVARRSPRRALFTELIPTDFPPGGFVGTDLKPPDMDHNLDANLGAKVALAADTRVVLCDEISSALDPELGGKLLRVVEALPDEVMTLLMVTREMNSARKVADRVVLMHAGRIHEMGLPTPVLGDLQTAEPKLSLSALH